MGHGQQLNLVLLGIGPPTHTPPRDPPELTVLEGIHPFDYTGCFTASKGDEEQSEEDIIALAFSDFEQTVEMMQVKP